MLAEHPAPEPRHPEQPASFTPARPTPPQWIWLIIGWLLPAAVLGVPYFAATYSQIERTGVVWGWGLFVVGGVALAVRVFGRTTWWQAAAAPLLGLLTVVVSRIAADVTVDPTAHNLWPFEVAIALAVGGAAAIAGAFLGAVIDRARRR